MAEHTDDGDSELYFNGAEWSFLTDHVPASDPPNSLVPLLSHPQESATGSESVMQDEGAATQDTHTMCPTTSDSVKSKRGARGKESDSATKRSRAPNWADDEKHALLMLKLEASVRGASVTEGATWNDFVSKTLKERHGFDRASKSCQQQWDSLKKQFEKIRQREAKLGTDGGTSYWKMKGQERENLELPHGFYVGWYVLMESMMRRKKSSQTAPSTGHVPPAAARAVASPDITEGLDMMHMSTPPEMVAEDHELFLRVAPFVDKQIDDRIQPIVSGLLVLEEDEQTYREKVLIMEMENLTLRRQRMDNIKAQCGAAGSAGEDDAVQGDRN